MKSLATIRVCISIVLALALFGASGARAQDDEPLPKPPAADQAKKAADDIRAAFAPLYAVKTAAGKAALLARLQQQAESNENDPAMRYALLVETRDIAADLGDVAAAAAAIDAVEEHFDADTFAMRTELVDRFARQIASIPAASAAAFTELAAGLVEEALAKENMVLANKLIAHTESGLRRVSDPARAAALRKSLVAQKELVQIYKRADLLQTKLLEVPDHAESLAFVGRFFCFIKKSDEKNNGKGLALLAKSSDMPVRAAAEAELMKDQEPTDRATTADRWLAAAKLEKSDTFKNAMIKRAIQWYESAVKDLTGIRKAAAETSLAEAYKASGLPAGYGKLTEAEREALIREGNRWFLVVRQPMTWKDAAAWCQERGGTLASVHSEQENQFIQRIARHSFTRIGNYRTIHLGGSDEQKEGDWRWPDGSPMRFRKWARNEGSAGPKENCMGMYYRGPWFDSPGEAKRNFVAEWKAQ